MTNLETEKQITTNSEGWFKKALRDKDFRKKAYTSKFRYKRKEGTVAMFKRTEVIPHGVSRVQLKTFDSQDGSLVDKRHAPKDKDLIIAVEPDKSITTLYAKDGQTASHKTLADVALGVLPNMPETLLYGSIQPEQRYLQKATHVLTLYQTPTERPLDTVDETMAQRLLSALSAERLEIVEVGDLPEKIDRRR